MSQKIEIRLPNSPDAREEVLAFLLTRGLVGPDKVATLSTSRERREKKQPFSAKWAGSFEPVEKEEPRYQALAKKYL